MEYDEQVKGGQNSYTTDFRQYDPRLGRWLSLDPLMAMFPSMSPYVAFDNNPIFYTDPYGLSSVGPEGECSEEETPKTDPKDKPSTSSKSNPVNLVSVSLPTAKRVGKPDKPIVSNETKELAKRAWQITKATSLGFTWSVSSNNLLGVPYVVSYWTGDPADMYNDDPELKRACYLGMLAGDIASIEGANIELGASVIVSSTGVGVIAGGPVALHAGGVITTATAHTVYVASELAKIQVLNHGSGTESTGSGNSGEITSKPPSGQTQVNSKTVWKGKGKERIDVENPNPSQRPGQVHYQDNNGNKYIYDVKKKAFKNAPKAVNDLLKNKEFMRGIKKGLKYLGYKS